MNNICYFATMHRGNIFVYSRSSEDNYKTIKDFINVSTLYEEIRNKNDIISELEEKIESLEKEINRLKDKYEPLTFEELFN